MYILIVGGETVGYYLARALLGSGHDVLIIDKNVRRCERINEELGSVAMPGDGSEAWVLKQAGAARADVLIAITGNDGDNLAVCQLAKQQFGLAKTIAVINDPESQHLFGLLGVDVAVSSTDVILSHIEEELPSRPLVHLMTIEGTERKVVSVTIPPDAGVVGKPLEELTLPPASFISVVIKKGEPHLADGEIALEANDEVVAITSSEEEESLWEVLTGTE
ncbi:MAG: potassium channel family protein [Dehalococcoidia bacterium]